MARYFKDSLEHQNDVCEWIANGGTMLSWSKRKKNFSRTAVFNHINRDPDFAAKIERAYEMSALARVEQMLEIVDEVADCEVGAKVQAAKNRADARKWYATVMDRKKFGDARTVDLQSTDGTMTPAPAVDWSRLDSDTLRKIREASIAPDNQA